MSERAKEQLRTALDLLVKVRQTTLETYPTPQDLLAALEDREEREVLWRIDHLKARAQGIAVGLDLSPSDWEAVLREYGLKLTDFR